MNPPEKRILLSRRNVLRDGALLMAAGSLSVSHALELPIPSAGNDTRRWTIGNETVQRVIAFQANRGLVTEQLSSLSTRMDLIKPSDVDRSPAQEFSFVCEGRECVGGSRDFSFVSADQAHDRKGKALTVRLRHHGLPLEVAVVYTVYKGQPALRKHLEIRNTSSRALHLSHMRIEALRVFLGAGDEMTLLTQYGSVPREIFYTGRCEDVCLLLGNGETRCGIAVMNEVPGWMKRTEIAGWDHSAGTHISVMYDTDLMPFERSLAPGETFGTASASLLPYRMGDGFNDPHWILPSYTGKVLERHVDESGPPWIYNTWEPFQRRIDHDTTMELIEAASAMGLDIFTIDDGWQQEYGENAVNLTAFPGGLEPILVALEKHGMRLGLWIPLAPIGSETAIYREHPEWAALDQQGRPKTTSTMAGSKIVMCMASAYRDAAAERVIDAIRRFRLAYVKLDLTTVFNAYGEAPGCWAKGHYHDGWAGSLNRIYEGIAYVTRKVYAEFPDVLLDLTYELWGQKHIIDAGLLHTGDLDWMSNVDDSNPEAAGPIQARQLLYQRAISMPVESMLIGNLHADMRPIAERFAVAIGSAPLLVGDLRRLSAADRSWYGEKISWFKQLRKTAKISESFFPLGSWKQTTPAAWDGFARVSRRGTGLIALFQNESKEERPTVQLPLLPEGRYRLRSIISGRSLGEFSRADWAQGVQIEFPQNGTVQILELQAQGA